MAAHLQMLSCRMVHVLESGSLESSIWGRDSHPLMSVFSDSRHMAICEPPSRALISCNEVLPGRIWTEVVHATPGCDHDWVWTMQTKAMPLCVAETQRKESAPTNDHGGHHAHITHGIRIGWSGQKLYKTEQNLNKNRRLEAINHYIHVKTWFDSRNRFLKLIFSIFTRLCNHCYLLLFQNILIIPKRYLVTISSTLPFAPPSTHWQPLIYFLSVGICLFWKLHVNGAIHYMTFCVWLLPLMFSRVVHVISCIVPHSFCGWKIFHYVGVLYFAYPFTCW